MGTTLVQGASRGLGLEFTRQLLARGESVIATCRDPDKAAGLQALIEQAQGRLTTVALDVTHEATIAYAADVVGERSSELDLLINVAGILHGPRGGPERRLDELEPDALHLSFAVNAIGPALVAKHFRRLLQHGRRAVWANLSARVGSIGDNRLGGWYGYRASKAAQNMLTRNLAIELPRHNRELIVVALHPGTVATELSRPFVRRVKHEVFAIDRAVANLLAIIDELEPSDNGRFIAWDGTDIPW